MPNEKHGKSSDKALWEYVSISDYECPIVLGADVVRQKWLFFKHLFRKSDQSSTSLKSEDTLQTFSQTRLEQLVPPIDWHSAVDALDCALKDWLQTHSIENPTKMIVGPPFSGNEEILSRWASRHNARLIASPTYQQILKHDQDWLDNWLESERFWVLPNLDKCFLRHAEGLGLVRRLLEMAVNGNLGPGIIGCNSWAWAFLRRFCFIPSREVLTLQAFDGERLSRLFTQLATQTNRKQPKFLNAKTGKTVLSDSIEPDNGVNNDLAQLAMHCRGNVEITRMYWRESLRDEPEKETLEDSSPDETIWVSHYPEEVVIPGEHDEYIAVVLHALLIHNGLPASSMAELLPFPHHHIMDLLLLLKSLNIVSLHNDAWHINQTGYLSVRQYLSAQNFLLDDF